MTRHSLPPLVDDLSLAYRLYPADGPVRGLVLLLHGVGSNEASLAGLAALLPADIAVALVRSPIALGPGAFCAFPVNFTAQGPVIEAEAAEHSRQALGRFIGEIQARTGIPAARTVIAGFSQGGIMAAGLALTSPAQVAGFAILSGRILPEITPLIAPGPALAHLQGLVLHGEADDRLPVAWAERSAELLQALGIACEQRRYGAGHEVTPAMAGDFAAWVGRVLA